MNRTATRITLTAGALVLGGAALAPSAMASSAYPPVTPPTTTTVVPPAQECTPVAGQKATDTPPAGRAATVVTTAGELPWYCVAPAVSTTTKPSSSAPKTLAYTGAEIGAVGAAGLGLVVAGAALVRGGRRGVSAA